MKEQVSQFESDILFLVTHQLSRPLWIFQVMRARAKVTTVPETKEVADATDHAKGITTTAATALFADHTTEEMGSLAKT